LLEKIHEIPQERLCDGLSKEELKDWPQGGHIEYKGVTASYHDDQDKILRNVSFEAKPGTFLAVVGRNGAGKSTLVNALVRLFELKSGKILIDGVDISMVPLEILRSRITMIS